MFKFIFFIGKHSRFIRIKYHKIFNNYPWGVIQFVKDYSGDQYEPQVLTQELFEKAIKEVYKKRL